MHWNLCGEGHFHLISIIFITIYPSYGEFLLRLRSSFDFVQTHKLKRKMEVNMFSFGQLIVSLSNNEKVS